ncbi:MAG TPA: hypothetical protein VGL86_00905, partial [Polyangia bacterium]
MTNVRRAALAVFACCCCSTPALADHDLYIGGLAQPQLRWEQQDPNATPTNPQNSGFALPRARIIAAGGIRG